MPKTLLAFEAVLFITASLVHAGVILPGFEHARAATAEGVIGAALALGVVGCFVLPQRVREIALATQAFALLGTMIGLFTVIIGIGPRTTPDYLFHTALLVTLAAGLAWFYRPQS